MDPGGVAVEEQKVAKVETLSIVALFHGSSFLQKWKKVDVQCCMVQVVSVLILPLQDSRVWVLQIVTVIACDLVQCLFYRLGGAQRLT